MIPRVIPVLTLSGQKLVKTKQFKSARYVGDPRNTVRLFNDKEVDELILLDISSNRHLNGPNFDLIASVVSEAFMPVACGGGISSLEHIERLLYTGVEKVVLGSSLSNFEFVSDAVKEFGSSTIVGCVDYMTTKLRGSRVCLESGTMKLGKSVPVFLEEIIKLGVGEIVIQSIDRDGLRLGYDHLLIKEIAEWISVPLVALGGADSLNDLRSAFDAGAHAMAASSMFMFTGKHQAVLVNFPLRETLEKIFSQDKI